MDKQKLTWMVSLPAEFRKLVFQAAAARTAQTGERMTASAWIQTAIREKLLRQIDRENIKGETKYE